MSGTQGADGKARQRARNAAVGAVARSGSSGVTDWTQRLTRWLARNPDLKLASAKEQGLVQPLGAMMLALQSYQRLANGSYMLTVVVPAHDGVVVDAIYEASRAGFLFGEMWFWPSAEDEDEA